MSDFLARIQEIFQIPYKFQPIYRKFGIFLSAFLLTATQNLWLFSIPATAQISPLLRVTNQFIPASTAPGVNSILRIQINNDGNTPLTSLSFIHPLVTSPAVLTISSTPTSTCGGTIDYTPGSFPSTTGSVSLSGGTLTASSSCIIDLLVQGFTAGNYIETITAASVTSSTISNQDPTSATLRVLSSVPMTLSKSFSPNTIPGDGRALATITITNSNPYSITGTTSPVALTDNLPANVTVDNRPGAITPTTTCAGGTVNTLAGNTGISLVGGIIPANSNCKITFNTTSSLQSTYTNTIPANTLSTVNKISNSNAGTANLNVQTQISLVKAFGTTTRNEEQTTPLTITITNGGAALTNTTLTDNLPDPLVVANATATTTCTLSGSSQTLLVVPDATSFTLNNSNVAGGSAQVPGSNPVSNALGTCQVFVNVKPRANTIANLSGNPPSVGAINTIPANALGNTEGRSNSVAATATMTVNSGLLVTKSYSPNFIAPGSTTRVTVNVNNRSGLAATGVGFTDNLPSGLSIADPPNSTVSASCGGGSILPALVSGGTAVTLTGASVAINATCSVNFDVIVLSAIAVGTQLDNIIPNNTITNNEGLDSDGVTLTEGRLTVVGRVTVNKTFTPNISRRGLPTLLSISITNNRRSTLGVPEPLNNVAITDNLPANLMIANPVVLSNSCGGSITGATPDSTSFNLSGGNILPTGSCTISLKVIEINLTQASFPTPTNYNNTPTAFSNAEGETATLPTATLTVVSPLLPTKQFQSPKIASNGISTIVISLSNSLPIALTNATFIDNWLQANTVVASVPNVSTTCLGGNVITVAGSRTVAVTSATIPPQIGGTSGLCTVRFDVKMDGTGASTFVNSLPAGGITTAEGFSNPSIVNATLTRVVSAVSLVKSISPTNIPVGQAATLTITIDNPGTGIDLTNLGFVDTMPVGMIFATGASPSTTCTGGTVLENIGSNSFTLSQASLNAGSSCNVSLPVTLNVTGNRTNTIGIGAVTSREAVTNNAVASASLSGAPAFTISKAFAPALVGIDKPSTLTIDITNRTVATVTGISVTDPLPANLVVDPNPSATTTCTNGVVTPVAGDTSIVMTGGSLAANGSCQIKVRVTSATVGTYVNTIPVGNLTATGGFLNHLTATAPLTVSSSPQMLLVKRITRINGTSLSNFVDDLSTTSDNNAGWPSAYLKGGIQVPNIRSKDVVEYTIYFLNANLIVTKNVRICDRLTANQTYVANSFNGLTPTDGGTSSVDLGMALAVGSANPTAYLTNINDLPDRGQFVAASAVPIPTGCGTNLPNVNGLVIVDVTRSPDLPNILNSTGAGAPTNSYGYIRFRVAID